jgi:uroporphyrinogen decarboxylase
MTSRERIIRTLMHNEPDKIPLDIGGTESSGFTGIAYNNLKTYLGRDPGKTQIFDTYQQVTKIEPTIREFLQLDTIPLLLEPLKWKPHQLSDGSACEIPEKWDPVRDNGDWIVKDDEGHITGKMPVGGLYFHPVYDPLAAVKDPSEVDDHLSDIHSFDWPGYADETMDDIEARAKSLYEDTDYAIVANLQCHLLAAGQILRGYENFMMDLVMNRSIANAILERLLEGYIKRCDFYLDRVGKYVQVVLVNDDLGTQQGPMLSIDCYKEMIWPYQKELFSYIKKKADVFVLLHSCGSVYRFIPYLIEAGVDALNPVQVSAAEMDSANLKKEFGNDISFWGGGCDTQRVLNTGTPYEIEEEVKKRIDDFAAGGGFVFTQVHNIQPDVPPSNIMAMIEAFDKYRGYSQSVKINDK